MTSLVSENLLWYGNLINECTCCVSKLASASFLSVSFLEDSKSFSRACSFYNKKTSTNSVNSIKDRMNKRETSVMGGNSSLNSKEPAKNSRFSLFNRKKYDKLTKQSSESARHQDKLCRLATTQPTDTAGSVDSQSPGCARIESDSLRNFILRKSFILYLQFLYLQFTLYRCSTSFRRFFSRSSSSSLSLKMVN